MLEEVIEGDEVDGEEDGRTLAKTQFTGEAPRCSHSTMNSGQIKKRSSTGTCQAYDVLFEAANVLSFSIVMKSCGLTVAEFGGFEVTRNQSSFSLTLRDRYGPG